MTPTTTEGALRRTLDQWIELMRRRDPRNHGVSAALLADDGQTTQEVDAALRPIVGVVGSSGRWIVANSRAYLGHHVRYSLSPKAGPASRALISLAAVAALALVATSFAEAHNLEIRTTNNLEGDRMTSNGSITTAVLFESMAVWAFNNKSFEEWRAWAEPLVVAVNRGHIRVADLYLRSKFSEIAFETESARPPSVRFVGPGWGSSSATTNKPKNTKTRPAAKKAA